MLSSPYPTALGIVLSTRMANRSPSYVRSCRGHLTPRRIPPICELYGLRNNFKAKTSRAKVALTLRWSIAFVSKIALIADCNCSRE